MTERVNGAGSRSPLKPRARPLGLDASDRSTVFGSSRIERVSVRPLLSRTVSRSSRCDGYSWSGAVNEPDATPGKLWIVCVWQLFGSSREQWRRFSVQVRPAAPIALPSASSAEPLKLTTLPTCQVVPAVGARMVGVGGIPAVIVTDAVSVTPRWSVTRSRTVRMAAVT